MISLFKNIPPSISVPAFYCFYTIAMIVRFLIGSAYGVLFLAVFFYLYVKNFTSLPVMTPSELTSWLVNLPSEYKVAVLSSGVTIIGFVVAFHTATENWRGQMQAQLKSQAANEIENFFSVVTSKITTTRLHVESLIKTVNTIQKQENINEIIFLVGYQQGKVSEFIAARDILSQASIEVHRLISKNNNILSTGWGLPSNINQAAGCLSELSKKMWVHIPMVNLDDPNHIQSFLNQVNVTECSEFIDSCNTNYGIISGISGGIQGYLTASIWGVSLSNYFNLISSRKQFKEAIKGLHRDLNKKS